MKGVQGDISRYEGRGRKKYGGKGRVRPGAGSRGAWRETRPPVKQGKGGSLGGVSIAGGFGENTSMGQSKRSVCHLVARNSEYSRSD